MVEIDTHAHKLEKKCTDIMRDSARTGGSEL